MTKSDIITVVANECKLSNTQAKEVVDIVFDAIKISLCKDEDVRIKDFGTFKVITRKEKKARDLSRGETIVIPEHKKVKFTPSINFKVD